MGNMKILAIGFAAIIVSGCTNGNNDSQHEARAGQIRRELFNECMSLAAKMPRQSDDDVADIVEECGSQSYYMSYAVTRK